MKLNKFKLFSVLIFIFFSFSLFGHSILADERGLEIQYPKIGEEEITTSTTISGYIKYIFKLSLIIAAVAVFVVLIYGGFRYLTSAGNPLAMDDAKKWIFGGIIGLALLLCSWLILNLIDPALLKPDIKPLEPSSGIYLVPEEGEKKHFYSSGAINIPEYFKAKQIEFISSKPQKKFSDDLDKPELISIFYYSDINRGGDVRKVENNKTSNGTSPSSPQPLEFVPRSLYFLWQKSGVYLYGETNLESPPVPKFYNTSRITLKDFNDKTKSIAFVDGEKNGEIALDEVYTAVLFEDTDYRGSCDLKLTFANIDNKLKSIAISKGIEMYGEVIFYDRQNCDVGEEGKKYVYDPNTLGDKRYGVVNLKDHTDLDQWLSFKINGNLSVLISTEKDLKGKCQLFSEIGCNSFLKGTSVFSSDPEGFRPKEAYIFPTGE